MDASPTKTRKTKAVEGMAAAMMEFVEATEEAARERVNQRFDQFEARMGARLDRMDTRLDPPRSHGHPPRSSG